MRSISEGLTASSSRDRSSRDSSPSFFLLAVVGPRSIRRKEIHAQGDANHIRLVDIPHGAEPGQDLCRCSGTITPCLLPNENNSFLYRCSQPKGGNTSYSTVLYRVFFGELLPTCRRKSNRAPETTDNQWGIMVDFAAGNLVKLGRIGVCGEVAPRAGRALLGKHRPGHRIGIGTSPRSICCRRGEYIVRKKSW